MEVNKICNKQPGGLKLFLNQRGSLTLEAVIVFPIFLALLILLINFVKITMVYVAMDHAVSETTKLLATQAYPVKYLRANLQLDILQGVQSELLGQIIHGEAVDQLLRSKISSFYPLAQLKEQDFQITKIKLGPLEQLGKQTSKDIALEVEYKVPLRVPFFPLRVISLTNSALERAWVDDLE